MRRRRQSMSCSPVKARWPRGWRRGTANSRFPASAWRGSWPGWSSAAANGRPRCSACPTARIFESRSSPASPGLATTGSTVAVGHINTDLPLHASDLLGTVAHETYPGHHLEHAWKEADLVDGQGRLESSILLINTPECLVSEGLANLARRFVVPASEQADLLVAVYERAGLAVAADVAAAREAAERTIALTGPRHALAAVRGNAAMLRHADGRTHEEVLDYLQAVGRYAPATAAKRLEFIEHPLWRTYVFVYAEGEALLARWVDAVPAEERPARFGRLLHEQLTVGSITGPG